MAEVISPRGHSEGRVPKRTPVRGYSPSYREIGEKAGLAVSTVSYRVGVLERAGFLSREPRQPRTIAEPADPATWAEDDEVELPLIGQIAAGVGLDAERETEETFLLSRRLVGREAVHAPAYSRLLHTDSDPPNSPHRLLSH